MSDTVARAGLHLNGTLVGQVLRVRTSTCWSFGTFQPNESFSEFAPLFGCWSTLMRHGGGDAAGVPVDPATLEALSRAERAIDGIDARLCWEQGGRWTRVGQLNIDGASIEWKEC